MKKFNAWPWAIVLVFLVFASGMIYVAVLFINNKPDLIVEDYYAAEVKFQEEINKIENANALEDGIQIDLKKDFIFLGFPETFNPDKTNGKVFLTRNDDAKMDKEWDLELDGNRQQAIATSDLSAGKWYLSVDWEQFSEQYLVKKELIIN